MKLLYILAIVLILLFLCRNTTVKNIMGKLGVAESREAKQLGTYPGTTYPVLDKCPPNTFVSCSYKAGYGNNVCMCTKTPITASDAKQLYPQNFLDCLDNPEDPRFKWFSKPENPNNCYTLVNGLPIAEQNSILAYDIPKDNIIGIVIGENCCQSSQGKGPCCQNTSGIGC
jgi:hypothetical protein